MKKILSGILALCLVVGLVACAKPAEKNPAEPTATKTTTQTTPTAPTESVAPTATKPVTSPSGPISTGQYADAPDLPDYNTFPSTGTSHYGEVTSAQIKVGKVTREIAADDPRLIRLLNFIGPAVKDSSISVVRQGLVKAEEIQDIDRTAPSVLKIKLASHEKFSEIWIYGDTFLGIRQAESAKDIRANQVSPYMCLATKSGWKLPSNQSDPTREVWIDLLQYAGFGAEIQDASTAPTKPAPTVATAAPGSFTGKTLTVYGLGLAYPYTDYNTSYYSQNYIQMMRLAADEWAAMQGVTIAYRGAYDQNTVIAGYSSGWPCDLIIPTDNIGLLLEMGLASPFTEAEYNTLATLVGDNRYLDVLGRKDQSYGMVLPWAGNMMVYFNQSMFAKYKVKSPLEYYNEGSWTWENFAKCMTEITRDTDGDGTTDIYGLPGDSWVNLVNPQKWDGFTGKMLSTIDDPWIQDFIQMKYNAYQVSGSSKNGENNIKTSTMFAMQISACETYDPQDVFKVSANGDALIAVPLPRWEGENNESEEWVKLTQMSAHIFAGTTEREATFDLLCYLTKCGMKYIADCSLGAISCDYAGIQGNTDASKKWKDTFTADIQQRKAKLEDQKDYDPTYVSKIAKALAQGGEWYVYTPYRASSYTYLNLLTCTEICEKPPAESIPIIKEKYLDILKQFNKAYYS